MSPKQPELEAAFERWVARLLVLCLAAAALGWLRLAEVLAVSFSGLALWSLMRNCTARSRLQTGMALPLLMALSPATVWPALWLALSVVVLALREKSWVARLASLMTIVFPALLLHASRAYLQWLGYRPFWAG
jgi:hypothetical protein